MGAFWAAPSHPVARKPHQCCTCFRVKTYATGKGNAAKDAVMAAAIKRYPGIDIPGNDIADAVILMAIGRRLAGQPLEDSLPATHLRALDKLVKP